MSNQLTAMQVYINMRTATPAIVSAMETLLKAKQVRPLNKASFEKSKNAAFKEFVAKWQIPIVEGTGRGGTRGGKAEVAKTLFPDANHPVHKIVAAILVAEKQLSDALKTVNRTLSPGYIRGEAPPKAAPAKS